MSSLASTAPRGIGPSDLPRGLPRTRAQIGACLGGISGVYALVAVLAPGAVVPVGLPHGARFSLLPDLGPELGMGGLLALAAVAAVFYVALIATPVDPPLRWIWAAVLGVHFAILLGPVILSHDVFSYVTYARLGALHGVDPYTSGPSAAPHDAAYAYVGWKHTPSVYGPLYTLLSYLGAPLGVGGAVWAHKGLAVASSLGVLGLLGPAAGRLGLRRGRALMAVGLNPMWLLWGVAGAHNDLLMLLGLTLGALWLFAGRPSRAGAAVVLAAAVKASAGLALPFVLIAGRSRALRGALIAAVGVAFVAWLGFGAHAFDFVLGLRDQQARTSSGAFPLVAAQIAGQDRLGPAVVDALHFLLPAALLTVLWRAYRSGRWADGAGWALLLTTVLATWFLPWYALWALPFAALSRDRRLLTATLAVQALVLVHLFSEVISS